MVPGSSFGDVFHGKFKGQDVAVKTLKKVDEGGEKLAGA